MLKRKNIFTLLLTIACACCFAVSFIMAKQETNIVLADTYDVETTTGVTISKDGSAYFTAVENWASKTLVFDIKTDGTITKFQLKGTSGGSGIIRSGSVDETNVSASKCAVENSKYDSTDESYWWANTVETLSDDWYRWYISLANLKPGDMSNSVVRIKCLAGSNVQIKNLHFLDGFAMYGGNGTKLHLPDTFSNWKDTTLQVDVNYSTGTQRRFQLCKTSGSGVSGIIRLTTTNTYVENITGDPYWLDLGTPINLGGNWYRHTIDLSKLKIADKRDGTESINQFNNLPESSDPNLLQIKNIRVGTNVYNPTKDATVTISSQYTNLGTTISSADWFDESSKDNSLVFDVYGVPSNSFEFSIAKDSSRKTVKFKFYDDGQIKSTEAGANASGTVVGTYSESVNGWVTVTINLYSLRQSSGSDINSIRTDNIKGNLYLNNIYLKKPYKPANDADMTWILGGDNDELVWGDQENGYISNWVTNETSITFDFHGTPNGNFSFAHTSGDRVTNKFYFGDNGKIYLNGSSTTEVGSYIDATCGNGWKTATINIKALGANGSASSDIKFIRNDGSGTLYVKDFTYQQIYNPLTDAELILEKGKDTAIPDVSYWGTAVISFEVYYESLDLNCDPQFIFKDKSTSDVLTSYFGYKNIGGKTGLFLRNARGNDPYWILSSTQPVATENGWYLWTIDLSELGSEGDRLATIGYINNRGSNDVYVKDFTIVTPGFNPEDDAKMTWAKGNNKIVDDDNNDVVIYDWAIRKTTISFDIFALPSSNNTLSFSSEKVGDTYGLNNASTVTKDNRISIKCYFNSDGNIYIDQETTNPIGSYKYNTTIKWYQVEIRADKLIDTSNIRNANRAIRYIRVGSDCSLLVKNFKYSYGEKTYDSKLEFANIDNVTDNGFISVGNIDFWQNHTLKFKSYGTICSDIGFSHDGELHDYQSQQLGYTLTYSFSVKDGVVGSYNGGATFTALQGCSCVEIENNWYQWTIPMSSLTVIPSNMSGVDATSTTLTHMWFSANVLYNGCFIKDIQFINDAIEMNNGASIRLADPVGIRFTCEIDASSSLLIGATNIEKGILILPSELLNGNALTINNSSAVKIVADKFLNEKGTKFTGVLTNIPEEYYGTKLTARGYISFTKNSKTYVLYSASLIRSISEVAKAALNDRKETADEEYKNNVTDGKNSFYSIYTQTQIDLIKGLIEPAVKLTTTYNGQSVTTVDETIVNYINNTNNTAYLAEVMYNRKANYEKNINTVYDYQFVNISWEDTGVDETYTVHIADNPQFTNEFIYVTTETSVSKEIGIFVPGKTYYYMIVGSTSGESKVDSFIANSPVRYISADTVINMRDLGGWETADNKTIEYGKLYRGAALDEGTSRSYLSEKGKAVFEYLGIKSEIDLRGDEDAGDTSKKYVNKINSENPILREGLTYLAYDQLVVSEKARAMQNLPEIFEFLANEDNYPIYFHCSVGADRTGTLAYIMLALLGVSYEDIMVEYELTSFSNMQITNATRVRGLAMKDGDTYYFRDPESGDTSFSGLGYAHTLLMEEYKNYSTNLQEVMEKYLLDVGVDQTHIDGFKSIMLSK